MAIIKCPGCSKKTSDKAATCASCGFPIGEHDADSLARKQVFQRNERLNKLVSYQMLAMLFFIAGIAGVAIEWQQTGWQQHMRIISLVVGSAALACYLLVRGRIFWIKRGN
ncbi:MULTISPECIES: hypothetical protein [Gammaproteobacteria]|uniref:hypothetical protein n=1 Tax=Gammaproteobacteria TaxID=1236 RepID=UPI000DCFE202|nr:MULTISPECIES: hypothetical protein [Gammaproteobacteria]RTE87206.1 hypothetical protein DQX04_02120 [Aliidiomarina sp. B3213]TCZ93006.1 hypothetical protein EYQ95_03185 [Lysobacter sp. N42]